MNAQLLSILHKPNERNHDILAKHSISKRYQLINEQKFLCFIVILMEK